MKTTLLIAASLASLSGLAGCSFAARSPEMYRDDTKAVLETKSTEIKACYDAFLKGHAGAAGKVTVNFEVETEQGKIQNVTVDKANTTAAPEIAECVTKSINGLAIAPPDKRQGLGTWAWEFSAPAPPKG